MKAGNFKAHVKPRLAMIAMGVIGTGLEGQGVPAISDMIRNISNYFDVTYYSFQPIDKKKIPSSVTVRQVISYRIPGRIKHLLLILRLVADHFAFSHQLLYSIGTFPTGRWAVLLGKLFNVPVIVHILSLEASGLSGAQYKYLVWPELHKITQKVCRHANEIIFLTEYQKRFANTVLTTPHSITVIPLSISLDRFPFVKRTISYPVKFIHVAYYHPVKDQATLFRAFAQIASKIDCELIIVGNGFEADEVKILLTNLKIDQKVFFKGQLRNVDLALCFKEAHILLHTSLFESECIVALEAMASGIPVCSTRVGIMDDLGEDFFVLAPVGDAHQLAEKVIALVRDPAHYSALQQKAYEWVVAHDSQWSARAYADVFTKWLRY